MNQKNKGLKELLRLREIVTWQIEIAKDHEILKKRSTELQNLDLQIEKLKQQEQIIKDNAL